MDAGLSFSYLKGVNRHLDWLINLSGSFPDSISKNIAVTNKKSLFLQSDFSIRARLLGKQKWFNPFLQSGLGFSNYRSNFGTYFLIGPGIELNYKDVFLITSLQYRGSLSNNLNNHYFYSIGIAGLIGKKEKKSKNTTIPKVIDPPIARDRDGDGILDSVDACPTTPGLAKFQGCPDSDGDGIEDRSDKCPTVFGFERYQGCPIPDRDKDGINDEEDQCIDVPGVIKYKGCPVPDTDGDSINDEMDSCVTIFGVKENKGCPLIEKEIKDKIDLVAKNIFFKTGSYEILPKSFGPLNEVVEILKQNPSFKLTIEGHTDNVGIPESNQILSENRAKAVMQYLIGEGIESSRLAAVGYGQVKPVDKNSTSKGRANNRRVEFKLYQKNLLK